MHTLNSLLKSTFCSRSQLTSYVSLRWKSRSRKPFWLGLARTKLFKIPERKVLPQDQSEELERLNYIYERQMRSLANFMSTKINWKVEKSEEELDLRECIEESKLLHERWNAESARLREERLKREDATREEAILSKIVQEEEKSKQIQAKIEQIVQKEIEMSETFITQENLDAAIDKCLASVSDYNYAMDLSGNVYKGEELKKVDEMKPVGASSEMSEMVPESSDLKENESHKEL